MLTCCVEDLGKIYAWEEKYRGGGTTPKAFFAESVRKKEIIEYILQRTATRLGLLKFPHWKHAGPSPPKRKCEIQNITRLIINLNSWTGYGRTAPVLMEEYRIYAASNESYI